jgi:hypothetical protein
MRMSGLMPAVIKSRNFGQPLDTYDYRNEAGELLYQVCRLEPKGFRQRRPDLSSPGGWSWSLAGVRRVPYRLSELLAADPGATVFICEGEKDCDRLVRMGLVASTNSGGAGKWRNEFAEHFRGRDIVILPDNDEPGRKHAQQVANSLAAVARSIKVVELPGLPEKGDVSDWLDAGGTAAKLTELVASAAEWRHAADTLASVSVVERDEPHSAGPADPGEFPQSLLDVPGFLGDVIAWNLSGAFKPQPVLALAGALCLLGTLTGRKVTDEVGTRTNLYCLGVGDTAAGKERARQVNKDILNLSGLHAMIGPESIGSSAGLVSVVEQQPSLLLQLDEIGRYLKTLGDSRQSFLYNIITVLMRLFTSSNTIYIGDAYADTKRIKTIYQPHVCVYGTTVSQSLYDSLTTESLTDGFLARTLVFEASKAMRLAPESSKVPQAIVEQARWWGEFNPGGNLTGQNPDPIAVATADDARGVFDEFSEFSDRESDRLGDPLGPLWSRAPEKARKLALLVACSSDRPPMSISKQAAQWAVAVIDFLTRRLVFLASRWIANSAYDAKVKRIMRIIEGAGPQGATKTRIGNNSGLSTRDRSEILDDLLQRGLIDRIEEQTATKPVTRFVASRFVAGENPDNKEIKMGACA